MKSDNDWILFFVGFCMSIFVIYDFGLWIVISLTSNATFYETRDMYLLRYPEFMRNARILTLINIFGGIVACLCFYRLWKSNLGYIKSALKIFLIFHLILISWQIFSLM